LHQKAENEVNLTVVHVNNVRVDVDVICGAVAFAIVISYANPVGFSYLWPLLYPMPI
jgi:hypothetical protein